MMHDYALTAVVIATVIAVGLLVMTAVHVAAPCAEVASAR